MSTTLFAIVGLFSAVLPTLAVMFGPRALRAVLAALRRPADKPPMLGTSVPHHASWLRRLRAGRCLVAHRIDLRAERHALGRDFPFVAWKMRQEAAADLRARPPYADHWRDRGGWTLRLKMEDERSLYEVLTPYAEDLTYNGVFVDATQEEAREYATLMAREKWREAFGIIDRLAARKGLDTSQRDVTYAITWNETFRTCVDRLMAAKGAMP